MLLNRIDRRMLLRGLLSGTGVSIGLPVLEAMLNTSGSAFADGAPLPKRLGVFFWGNGVKLDRWTPKNTGSGWTPSEALAPLQSVKDYVNVVSGMNIQTGNDRGHHAGCVGILSGAPMVSQPHPNSNYASTFSKPSIDQVAANAIGKGSRFKSLEVGVSRRVVNGEGTTLWYLSHNGPDSPNPPEYDPSKVYNRIFGADFVAKAAGPQLADITRKLRKSALDAVSADVSSLRARVGSDDKKRLDQHLENIRSIENRLADPAAPAGASCAAPMNPGTFPDKNGQEQIEEKMRAMSDLLAMSLACDQTRVFSVMFTGSVGYTAFWEVGTSVGHHDLTHNEAGDQPMVQKCTVFTMQQFAYLLNALKSVSEGAGNLLDNCAILASSDTADGRDHSINDYPILVAGKAGGALKTPSVHYRSPNGENTSKVLLSVLRSVGVPLTEFGDQGGHVTEGLTAIEA